MPSEPPADARGNRRLHPSSLLFSVGGAAGKLLLPGIVVMIASRGSNYEIWLMILFVPAVIGSVLKFLSYRYRLDEDELVVRQGIIFRSERNIPYARIQNVDLVRNPAHRLFGVAVVRLETASGQRPEATMRVLSLGAVETMRSRIFAGRREDAPSAGPDTGAAKAEDSGVSEAGRSRVVHTLSVRDVILFGLISNKGMVVVAAAMGVAWQLDLFEKLTGSLSRESFDRVKRTVPWENPLVAAMLGIATLVILLVLMRALSVAWALLKFHGFRLRREGDDLRGEYGLFTQVSKTIPRNRIQVLSTHDGPLHRWAGRTAVQVETAGGVERDQGGMSDRLWLAPLIRKEQSADLIREALPEVDLDDVDWRPVSSRAGLRRFRRSAYAIVVIGIAGAVGLGPWGVLPAVALLPLAWVLARLYVKYTAYAMIPGAVLYRSGWWLRTLSIARFSKIQSLELAESPFDRRHGMASIRLDTAGATRIGHGVHVSYLDTPVATRLMDRLADEAGRTAFRW